jgi:hypothetical protein
LPTKEMNIIAHKALGAQIVFQTQPSPKYDKVALQL